MGACCKILGYTLGTMAFLACLGLILAGCGGEKPQGPDAAVEDFIHRLNSREFEQAYDTLASSSRYRAVMTRAEFSKETERFFPSSAASSRLSEFKATSVVVDGDTAEVSWSAMWAYGFKGETGDTIHVTSTAVNEDGVWRVSDLWGDA